MKRLIGIFAILLCACSGFKPQLPRDCYGDARFIETLRAVAFEYR